MRKRRPRLADVQCTRLQFQPGDKLIVRHYERLDKSDREKLRKCVERWAGDHVEVLVVDATKMEIYFDKRR